MSQHKFIITSADTDSIMFCKPDMSPITEQEQSDLLDEINSLLPKMIKFSNDGYFTTVLILKAKNYVMVDTKGNRKVKGGALKSATLEPIIKKMIGEFVEVLLTHKPQEDLVDIYHKYIKIASNITDIKPWAKKMTLSPTTFNSKRKNETDIVNAIKGTEYKSGDKIYTYRTNNNNLALAEQFDGCYNKDDYYEKLYKATRRFEEVIPVDKLFKNYALKRSKKDLEILIKTNET